MVFDLLKSTITIVSILVFPDTIAFFCIEADSSNFVMRIVLLQAPKKDSK